jgi:hypothetical protein
MKADMGWMTASDEAGDIWCAHQLFKDSTTQYINQDNLPYSSVLA